MSEHRSKQGSIRRRAKPSKERLHGHLRVALWYVYEGRCAYTGVGHKDILTQLLPGAKIGRAAGERPFLVGELSGNRGWWIQLSNVRIELTPHHTEELCEVVDCLAECYMTVAEDLERYVLQSIRFPYVQQGYR